MALEIKNISVAYDNEAVINNIDLRVDPGQICTIVGPSGCGKSTLLKAIAGLLTPVTGEVLFSGKHVDSKMHTIGYIPQSYGLLPWQTVQKNIETGLKLKKLPLLQGGVSVAKSVLSRVGLDGFSQKFPRELSGGQQQRVAIAKAFALAPDILLMDEPFSALDAMTKEEMQDFFLEIWHRSSGTTIFITHDIEEAVLLGDKVVVLGKEGIIATVENEVSSRDDDDFHSLCREVRKFLRGGKSDV